MEESLLIIILSGKTKTISRLCGWEISLFFRGTGGENVCPACLEREWSAKACFHCLLSPSISSDFAFWYIGRSEMDCSSYKIRQFSRCAGQNHQIESQLHGKSYENHNNISKCDMTCTEYEMYNILVYFQKCRPFTTGRSSAIISL